MGSIAGDVSHPELGIGGQSSRVTIAEVVAINVDDGTIDARPIKSRATQVHVPYPTWWIPRMGERCLLAQDLGDQRTPVCLGYFAPADGSLVGPQAQFTVAPAVLPKASDTSAGIVRLSAAAAVPADPIAVSDQDPRLPTAGEANALLGTSGTPGSSNKYVTNADSRNSDARSPSGAAGGDLAGNFPSPTIRAALLALINGAIQPGAAAGGDLTGNFPNPTLRAALLTLINGAIQAGAAVGGDLTGSLPNPQVADRAVKNTQISSTQGALTFDAGGLGLTFPAGGGGLTFAGTAASGLVLESDGAGGAFWGSVASIIGTLGGDLTGTLPNPTLATITHLVTLANFLQFGTGGTYGSLSADTGGGALAFNFNASTGFQLDGAKPSWRILSFYSNPVTSDFWKVQRADPTHATNVAPTWVDYLTIATDGQITLAQPINRYGTLASRPATAPSGTTYLSADLIFPAGGGGLTLPQTFGLTDGDTYLSDGGSWTRTDRGTGLVSPARAAVKMAAASAATASGTWLGIPFDTAIRNDFGMWAVGTPTKFTAPEAGTYLFTANVSFAGNVAGTRVLALFRNNSDPNVNENGEFARDQKLGGPAANFTGLSCTGQVELAAGDTVLCAVIQTSGGALNVQSVGDLPSMTAVKLP